MKPLAVAGTLFALVFSPRFAHAQETPADRLPRQALQAYCAAAGDMLTPALFGEGRTGPAIAWRCVKGVALLCTEGADGVACSARSRSRVPLPAMVQACRQGEGLSVASGAYSFVWAWDCRAGKPVIVGPAQVWGGKPTRFDDLGYADEEWSPLR